MPTEQESMQISCESVPLNFARHVFSVYSSLEQDFTHGSLSPLDYHVLTLYVNNNARYTCHDADVLYAMFPNLDVLQYCDKSTASGRAILFRF